MRDLTGTAYLDQASGGIVLVTGRADRRDIVARTRRREPLVSPHRIEAWWILDSRTGALRWEFTGMLRSETHYVPLSSPGASSTR